MDDLESNPFLDKLFDECAHLSGAEGRQEVLDVLRQAKDKGFRLSSLGGATYEKERLEPLLEVLEARSRMRMGEKVDKSVMEVVAAFQDDDGGATANELNANGALPTIETDLTQECRLQDPPPVRQLYLHLARATKGHATTQVGGQADVAGESGVHHSLDRARAGPMYRNSDERLAAPANAPTNHRRGRSSIAARNPKRMMRKFATLPRIRDRAAAKASRSPATR